MGPDNYTMCALWGGNDNQMPDCEGLSDKFIETIGLRVIVSLGVMDGHD